MRPFTSNLILWLPRNITQGLAEKARLSKCLRPPAIPLFDTFQHKTNTFRLFSPPFVGNFSWAISARASDYSLLGGVNDSKVALARSRQSAERGGIAL